MPSASVQVCGNTNEVRGQQCDGVWRTVAPSSFKQSMKIVVEPRGECCSWPPFVLPGCITTEALHKCFQASDRQLSCSVTELEPLT